MPKTKVTQPKVEKKPHAQLPAGQDSADAMPTLSTTPSVRDADLTPPNFDKKRLARLQAVGKSSALKEKPDQRKMLARKKADQSIKRLNDKFLDILDNAKKLHVCKEEEKTSLSFDAKSKNVFNFDIPQEFGRSNDAVDKKPSPFIHISAQSKVAPSNNSVTFGATKDTNQFTFKQPVKVPVNTAAALDVLKSPARKTLVPKSPIATPTLTKVNVSADECACSKNCDHQIFSERNYLHGKHFDHEKANVEEFTAVASPELEDRPSPTSTSGELTEVTNSFKETYEVQPVSIIFKMNLSQSQFPRPILV
jgi:hypothetical protein